MLSSLIAPQALALLSQSPAAIMLNAPALIGQRLGRWASTSTMAPGTPAALHTRSPPRAPLFLRWAPV
jgi:hypothetical protein